MMVQPQSAPMVSRKLGREKSPVWSVGPRSSELPLPLVRQAWGWLPLDLPLTDPRHPFHVTHMEMALAEAEAAALEDEVPIGAVVTREGKIIARAHNQTELLKDATAHAEMLALTAAEEAVHDWRLTDCNLYVTKEPCVMCAGAIVHTRIRRVIFGCADVAAGAVGSMINVLQMPGLNHRCEITSGVLQNQCAAILQDFFQKRRQK